MNRVQSKMQIFNHGIVWFCTKNKHHLVLQPKSAMASGIAAHERN